ncbi:CLUMA_CG010859, isoform A [Clunio marinus]|uniref:CLUMA_CG010859, isoform A n=1 Tax=Clunio marinus TaxID=568069 RepID=A0A1J1IEP4_9DIPT|nr:CLUMA_CG010859, isoform A [Clunio marinus]
MPYSESVKFKKLVKSYFTARKSSVAKIHPFIKFITLLRHQLIEVPLHKSSIKKDYRESGCEN